MKSIDESMKLGANHPMGPLELADFIGLDTCLAIMNVLHDGLADTKYRPCPLLTKYVEAGWLGRKTQRGFYDYRGETPGADAVTDGTNKEAPRGAAFSVFTGQMESTGSALLAEVQRVLAQPGHEAARIGCSCSICSSVSGLPTTGACGLLQERTISCSSRPWRRIGEIWQAI